MALDQNLMGLGLAAPLAARVANAGTGPVSVTASGQTIGGKQFVVYVTSGGTLVLPAVGGSDMAPEIGDDFVIHNGTGGNLTVNMVSSASISVGGSNTNGFTLSTHTTMSMWVVSTTQWFGIKN